MDHSDYAVILVNKIGEASEEIYFKTVEDYISYDKSINSVNAKQAPEIDLITITNNTKEKVHITKDNWKDLELKVGDKVAIGGVFIIKEVEHESYRGNQPFYLGEQGWPNLSEFKCNIYKVEE